MILQKDSIADPENSGLATTSRRAARCLAARRVGGLDEEEAPRSA
ncbi:hypothetical protein [Sorangium sp. So ce145]